MTALDPKALDAAFEAWNRSGQRDLSEILTDVINAYLSALNRDDVVERCKYAMGAKLLPIHDDDLDLLARAVLAELGIGEG